MSVDLSDRQKMFFHISDWRGALAQAWFPPTKDLDCCKENLPWLAYVLLIHWCEDLSCSCCSCLICSFYPIMWSSNTRLCKGHILLKKHDARFTGHYLSSIDEAIHTFWGMFEHIIIPQTHTLKSSTWSPWSPFHLHSIFTKVRIVSPIVLSNISALFLDFAW